ncbi:FecR family protein [Methylobacter sp. BBA5.1]|jgi:transmembrane sensor|uniref:FecR family protein n=1 Tax=Methylobacter sp. BBA5.1 TaxID=1495064 RepID=UPI00055CA2D5|nr:FecR family protein [Methylobacter sp. BBA5.1]
MSSSSSYNERQLKQAIEWFVRLQAEKCPAEDRLRFEAWLAKGESHQAAYAEAERIWANMDDIKFMPVSGLAEARSAKPRKPASVLTSLAFFIVTTALLGGAWLEYSAETVSYVTGMGERRRIDLTDNSHIDLNTDTLVSVRISLLQRSVVLTQGEALFEVSHDRLRPFTVQVGDLHIRDVGTRFNVLKQPQGATVSVLEGEVELNNGQDVVDVHLSAGDESRYTEATGLGRLQAVEADQLTAWLHGRLVFKRTPLREVALELERYHPVRFIFADPKLAEETLSGIFNSDDIDLFLHALEDILPLQAKRDGQQIQLRRTRRK